ACGGSWTRLIFQLSCLMTRKFEKRTRLQPTYPRGSRRIAVSNGLLDPFLPESKEIKHVASDCRTDEGKAILPEFPEAALHVAVSVVNGIEYLLTWNYKHLANAGIRSKIEVTCRELGSCGALQQRLAGDLP
ncbi:MAG: hypothetical protein NTV69_02390, partial [Caldilinea sp.]|nr:hypothetical protein [Caldilinea sp.]